MKHRHTVSVSLCIENLELTNTSNYNLTSQISPLTGSYCPQCLSDQTAPRVTHFLSPPPPLHAQTLPSSRCCVLTCGSWPPPPDTNKHPPLPTCILPSPAGPSPLPADTLLTLPGLPPHPTHSPTICFRPSTPAPTNALFTSSDSTAAQTLASPTGL